MYSEADQGFIVKAAQDIGIGDQIHVNYGEKTNQELFLNYAFLLDENVENDVVLLSLELDRDSGLYTEKYEMLAQDWHAQSFYARLNLQDHNVESMLKFARFSAFDKEHGDVSVLE
jgi:hypothetical protein